MIILQELSMTVHDYNTMQRLLHPYLDHELSVETSMEIHSHLILCTPCKTLYHRSCSWTSFTNRSRGRRRRQTWNRRFAVVRFAVVWRTAAGSSA